MLRKIFFILFISIICTRAEAQGEICSSEPPKAGVLQRLAQLMEIPLPPPRRNFAPWRNIPNTHWSNDRLTSATPLAEVVDLSEKCLGEYGCVHSSLHQDYREAFAKLKCHCHTGFCRPSKFRAVPISATNDSGRQIWANNQWCDVMMEHLRRDRSLIPERLLSFRAHVCVGSTGCESLECAIDPSPGG